MSVLSPTCLLYLHLSLTSLAGFYACWSVALSLLCDCTTYVPLPALHEAMRALTDTTGVAPSHLCDTWRWLTGGGALCRERPTSHAYYQWCFAVGHCRCEDCHGGTDHYPLPGGHSPVSSTFGFRETADATSRELLSRWNPFFRRMHGNSFRARLRQLLNLTEADQSPEFRGTQYSKLVMDPISQRLTPQLRSPWAEWHKKDGAGQWAVVLDMPTRPLNTPHVAPDILHQIYPYVLWWAADLVATPQRKFLVGSPANVKVRKILAEQAPRVLEASTLLIREEDMMGQVMDFASPPWAPASILALHLASGLRDPMSMCSPHELLRTPRLPKLSGVVWTAAGEVDTPAELGGFWLMMPSPLFQPTLRPAPRKKSWIS